MSTVTLIDGREVDSASPEWRAETLARQQADDARHIANLMRLMLTQRRDYLENLLERHGPVTAQRVRDAFSAAWAARTGKPGAGRSGIEG